MQGTEDPYIHHFILEYKKNIFNVSNALVIKVKINKTSWNKINIFKRQKQNYKQHCQSQSPPIKLGNFKTELIRK